MAVAMSVPASAVSQPTLTSRSDINGRALPSLATGQWQPASTGGWQAVLHIAASPSGKTTVDATWTSPVVKTRYDRPFFSSAINIDHRGVSGSGVVESAVTHSESLRLCDAAKRRCGRSITSSAAWPNEGFDLASDPFVGVMLSLDGAVLDCSRGGHRWYAQWRTHVTQSDVDVATVTLDVAAGQAAERAQPTARCPQRRR